MRINKRLVAAILTAVLWITTAAYTAAAPSGFKTWPHKVSGDINKVWSVKFNIPLDPNTINNDTVYVTDQSGSRINAKLSLTADKRTVNITPVVPYIFGKQYNIYITSEVAGANGTHLAQPVMVPFTITDDNIIISVESTYTSLVTNITLIAGPDVYRATVNSKEMHYEGSGVYKLGIRGLKPGDNVTINAYDANGKLLESTKHTIQ